MSKSATATALNWSEVVLFLGGVVLVAGLVGEYKTHEPHSRRMKFFEMLVILGVLTEMLADGGIFLFSHQLQVISDHEIAEANAEALDAKSSALGASAAAGEAETKAKNADIAAGDASLKVKGVGAQADRIGAMLGETISLVNARRVDDPNKLRAEFRKHFIGQKIQLVSYAGDLEAWGLCNQLVNITKDAGMVPEDICGKAWFTSPLISPLSVTAPTWDEALGISGALSSSGNIVCSSLIGPHLIIFVGVKSPFIIGETAQTRDVERRAAAMKKQHKPDAKH